MDLNIEDKEVRFHVRRILSFKEEERVHIWKSQYDNESQNYKHPLANEIKKELLRVSNIKFTKHKFSMPINQD